MSFYNLFHLISYNAYGTNNAYGSYNAYGKKDDSKKYYAPKCPQIDGQTSQCRPIKDCAVWFDVISTKYDTACKLADGQPGACCPPLPYNSTSASIFLMIRVLYKKFNCICSIIKGRRPSGFAPITGVPSGSFGYSYQGGQKIQLKSVQEAANAACQNLGLLQKKEKQLIENKITVRPNSAEQTHLRFFHSNQKTREESRNALVGLETTAALGSK